MIAPQTVVISHHLDSSRDTTYVHLENQLGLRATYAVLLDWNRRFWLRTLRGTEHEIAFHYTTKRRSDIAGEGLIQQLAQARRKGIPIHTLHRHWENVWVPEYHNALTWAVNAYPEILGANSYGIGRFQYANGMTNVKRLTDTWTPWQMCPRVWESSSVQEPSLEDVATALDAPTATPAVYVLVYHPAHTWRMLKTFHQVIAFVQARGIPIRPLCEVYADLNRQQVAVA